MIHRAAGNEVLSKAESEQLPLRSKLIHTNQFIHRRGRPRADMFTCQQCGWEA